MIHYDANCKKKIQLIYKFCFDATVSNALAWCPTYLLFDASVHHCCADISQKLLHRSVGVNPLAQQYLPHFLPAYFRIDDVIQSTIGKICIDFRVGFILHDIPQLAAGFFEHGLQLRQAA